MKSLTKLSIVLCAFILAAGLASAPVEGQPKSDALDAIAQLQNQVAGLQAKVTALEARVQQLQNQNTVVVAAVPEMQSSDVHIPIQVTPQSEILKVYRRGLFLPAEAR